MKWLAIIFLLANVLIFGWQMNDSLRESVSATAAVPPLPPRTPSLRLLSELPELPPLRESAIDNVDGQPSQADSNPVVEAVDLDTELNDFGNASDTCIDIGPITNTEQLDNIRAWLRLRATAVHTRKETVRERRFFWVYLESTSDEQAQQNVDDLERSGVTDYLLIHRGGLKNAISLGLFRSQDSVNRRLAEMTQQGYKPVVVPKFESTEHYFIRATMAQGHEDTDNLPENLLGEATLEPANCANVAQTLPSINY